MGYAPDPFLKKAKKRKKISPSLFFFFLSFPICGQKLFTNSQLCIDFRRIDSSNELQCIKCLQKEPGT
jgi:hypothetical protein